MSAQHDIISRARLPAAIDSFLRSTNPWWEGKPGRAVPDYRRWLFDSLVKRLHSGLTPAVVVRGARQVGKTTLQEQVIQQLIETERVAPRRILRVQFDEIPSLSGLDDPLLALADWFSAHILGQTFNEAARDHSPAFVFLDELQNISAWAPQLKALVDHHSVRVAVTGSSALRIEAGRDSLAGRITTLELGTLLLREIAEIRLQAKIASLMPANGLEPLVHSAFWKSVAANGRACQTVRNRAFRAFSERGGYPTAQIKADTPWAELADHLNETVIHRVIRHDLRLGERGRQRDAALMEEIFRLACRYAGQAPSQATYLAEARDTMQAGVSWQRIQRYLRFLDGAMLLKLVRPIELRLKRQTKNAKLCLVDLGLRGSWLEEQVPLDVDGLQAAPHLTDLAGHLAESAVGAFLCGLPNLDVAYFPERPTEPEVDFVLTIGDRRIPVEIKYRRRIDPHRDTFGLRAFIEKTHYNAAFGILVTLTDDVEIPDPRIVTMPLSSLLLMR